jgi:hypothetical protein
VDEKAGFEDRPRLCVAETDQVAVYDYDYEGGFTVSVPSLPGCICEGDTFEEALENIGAAIDLSDGPVKRFTLAKKIIKRAPPPCRPNP